MKTLYVRYGMVCLHVETQDKHEIQIWWDQMLSNHSQIGNFKNKKTKKLVNKKNSWCMQQFDRILENKRESFGTFLPRMGRIWKLCGADCWYSSPQSLVYFPHNCYPTDLRVLKMQNLERIKIIFTKTIGYFARTLAVFFRILAAVS